jgi:hypothetical protein
VNSSFPSMWNLVTTDSIDPIFKSFLDFIGLVNPPIEVPILKRRNSTIPLIRSSDFFSHPMVYDYGIPIILSIIIFLCAYLVFRVYRSIWSPTTAPTTLTTKLKSTPGEVDRKKNLFVSRVHNLIDDRVEGIVEEAVAIAHKLQIKG